MQIQRLQFHSKSIQYYFLTIYHFACTGEADPDIEPATLDEMFAHHHQMCQHLFVSSHLKEVNNVVKWHVFN